MGKPEKMSLTAIKYCCSTSTLSLLDQRLLPETTQYNNYTNSNEVASAIRSMVVRGAPAIGITAAYGMAIAQKTGEDLEEAYRVLADSRPTAVNLKWALDKVRDKDDIEKVAIQIHNEDIELNKKLGNNGAEFLRGGVLHICNTGALATGGWGTALGMIRSALANGNNIEVFACETRPYNQGARCRPLWPVAIEWPIMETRLTRLEPTVSQFLQNITEFPFILECQCPHWTGPVPAARVSP